MESPPSSSTWSEAFILSDDSGLLLTNGSASSSSMNDDSKNGKKYFAFEDSDCEEKSLSQDDSFDAMSDIMCGENFNTLKKGPNWHVSSTKHFAPPIEPPPEFQDRPSYSILDYFCEKLTSQVIQRAFFEYREYIIRKLRILSQRQQHHYLLSRPYITAEFMPFSPCHIGRPSSRSSLGSSRLSSSHNSLSVPNTQRLDDSNFITQAVSHDTLSPNLISDLYNVPFDSDVYAVPVDVVKPPLKPKRMQAHQKKKRRNTASGCKELENRQCRAMTNKKNSIRSKKLHCFQTESKRHSVAGTSASVQCEPIHMTLQEVRQYLQTLYSSSSESSDQQEKNLKPKQTMLVTNNNKYPFDNNNLIVNKYIRSDTVRPKKNTFLIHLKNKKVKDSCDTMGKQIGAPVNPKEEKRKKSPTKLFSFKQALCNLFRFRRFLSSPEPVSSEIGEKTYGSAGNILDDCSNSICSRALPPLPHADDPKMENYDEQTLDFATSIQKVKDYGWYWGPISSEAAEKILSNEPDGSFIVRDSSDDHYIFSLTFKLNNSVRHVRIEHDQGNFSFGSCTKFKSQTIVEFIENAVEHSRSGRYLFFLHRRPVIGPVRVQLLHPVSRFKQVQSLQHICRFIIHKHIRRDLIPSLPLPRRMIDYLNTPHYYSEHFVDLTETSDEQFSSNDGTIPILYSRNQLEENPREEEEETDPNVPVNYIIMNNANSDVIRQS